MSSALVILAHTLDHDGQLSEESKRRLVRGAELYLSGGYRRIILPGGSERLEGDIPIADIMADYLHTEYGIARRQLTTEPRSRDTGGDAIFVGERLEAESALTVVTSHYHVERVQYVFEFFLSDVAEIKVVGVEAQASLDVLRNETESLAQFRSHFPNRGRSKEENFQILSTKHPLYNGDMFPHIVVERK